MVDKWTVSQVQDWLNDQGFWSYSNLLCNIHKIDGKALLMLKESDLRSPPILIETPLGDLKRLYLAIHTLQKEQRKENGILSQERAYRRRELSSISSWSDDLQSINRDTGDGYISEELDPELWKTALSFIYAFAVCLLTSFVMVIVHDRVPDMERYPPLPDLVLDNVPLIPKAFDICEGIIITLCVIWGLILLFHRHRFILLRRFFSLGGTVFLLRCVTMLITSLSVPGVHLNCKPHQNKDLVSQFWRAVEIWKCFGMSLRGARSCGDYMFSGHTVCLTLLNFFITEYTSRRLYYLHTFTWVLNMFGIFFILAAHEHYSIDVFIAFYISSRLFVYYHTLANNRTLATADEMKTRINFPLFVFFESKCCGAVPNVFLWPLPWPCSLQRLFNNSKKQQ